MLERLGAGAMALIVGQRDRAPERAEDYEAALAPLYAWIHAIAQTGGPEPRPQLARDVGSGLGGARGRAPGGVAAAGSGGGFPGGDRGSEPRRARPAAGRAERDRAAARGLCGPRAGVRRLGIDARYVLFGHTHRAGPLARDDRSEWTVRRRGPI